jgi:deoxyribodipyrimidine photolyase-related protein
MSDYCKGCHYKVTAKTGETACPFNVLYWDFLIRHEERFSGNPRMGQMYRVWERMDEERRDTVLSDAAEVLAKLDRGEVI